MNPVKRKNEQAQNLKLLILFVSIQFILSHITVSLLFKLAYCEPCLFHHLLFILGGPVVRTVLSLQEHSFHHWIWELRSYTPLGMAKKREKKQESTTKTTLLRMFTLIWQKLLFPNRLVVIRGNTTDHIFPPIFIYCLVWL